MRKLRTTHYALRITFYVLLLITITSVSNFAQVEPLSNRDKLRESPQSGEAEKESDFSTHILEEVVVTEGKIPTANTIATKIPLPLRSTPASVGIVTSSIFDAQNGIILGDALKNVSGANVQTGFGVHDFFIIRGFDSLANGLVLMDGASEPEVTFYNLYNIDRVEVLKGPGAFLYGGNPLSGTVNLSRKQPIFKNFSRITGSYGHFQSYRGILDMGLADLNAGVAFRMNALWQDSDNYRDNKENSSISVNPAFTWRLNRSSYINFNFEYVNSEYKSDSGLPIINEEIPNPDDVPRTRSYQSPFDISEQEIYRARIDFNTKISESLTLRNKFYYTDFDWPSKGTLFNGAFPNEQGATNVFRSLLLLDDHQKLIGNQLEALLSVKTGAVQHTLLTGFEFSRLGDEFTLDVAALPSIDLFNPSIKADTEGQIIQSSEADARSLVLAPYFVNQVSFSEKYQVFLGGRFDGIDYEDKVTDTSRDYKKFSPMLGFVHSPTVNLSFYANAGQAFAPPSSRVVGDREVEESTQFEVGAKKQLFNGKLNTALAFYHLKKDNIAIPDDSGVTQQTGDGRSRGIEFELVAEPMQSLYTFITYAFSDAELTEFREQIFVPTQDGVVPIIFNRSGNTPAFAPKHILNFWVSKDFNFGLGIGGGGRYVSSQFIAEDNVFKIDDVLTFDAALYYSIGNWRWRVNFKNLTDRKYETRGFGSASVIPANPFAVYGAVEFSL